VLQTAPVITAPELYCVVPREFEDSLVSPLHAALAERGIKVIVERRNLDAPTPYEVRRQRALHLPRAMPELPAELADSAASLSLVQRMPSPGLTFADETLPEVVAAVRTGDAVAASELVWRMHARVCTRLGQRHGQVAGIAMTDTAMGAMLDALEGFRGQQDHEFLHWLDRLVDSL
jgi:hypothetical protein